MENGHMFLEFLLPLLQQQQADNYLSDNEISRLPLIKITSNQMKVHKLCMVCLEDFRLTEDVLMLSCFHLYHQDCITPWLRNNNTCPTCRTKVEIDDRAQNIAQEVNVEMDMDIEVQAERNFLQEFLDQHDNAAGMQANFVVEQAENFENIVNNLHNILHDRVRQAVDNNRRQRIRRRQRRERDRQATVTIVITRATATNVAPATAAAPANARTTRLRRPAIRLPRVPVRTPFQGSGAGLPRVPVRTPFRESGAGHTATGTAVGFSHAPQSNNVLEHSARHLRSGRRQTQTTQRTVITRSMARRMRHNERATL